MKVELSKEEKAIIEAARKKAERLESVNNEVTEVLKKYNATIRVDDNSPINNLKVVLVLLD